jgi:outer membrane lipoprotein-sorting protein
MQMRTRRGALLLAAVVCASAAALQPGFPAGAAVAAAAEPSVVTDAAAVTSLLQRFDEAQMRTQTMIASFVERKRVRLLVDEQVQTGTFLYTKPSQFLWEYSPPDGRVMRIDSEELLVYYPKLKKAEEIDISRYSKRILRFFGLGQPTAELRKYYDLSLAEDPKTPDTYLLILSPIKRRVAKRLDSMRIWIDRDMMVPRQVEYVEPDGDSTRVTFRNIEINSPISPARYDVKIPPGVQISNTFSGFSGVQQGY